LAVWWLLGKVLALAAMAAALAAAVVLVAEAAVGVRLLGAVFERFDWTEGSAE